MASNDVQVVLVRIGNARRLVDDVYRFGDATKGLLNAVTGTKEVLKLLCCASRVVQSSLGRGQLVSAAACQVQLLEIRHVFEDTENFVSGEAHSDLDLCAREKKNEYREFSEGEA